MAKALVPTLAGEASAALDSSTRALVARIRGARAAD